MEISYRIFPDHKLVYVTVRGKNTVTELMSYIMDIPNSDARHSADMDYLIDTRQAEATGEPATSERTNLQSFIGDIPDNPQHAIKSATVLPSGALEYGLSRMYGVEMERSMIEYQLFDDMGAALKWLERPSDLLAQLEQES